MSDKKEVIVLDQVSVVFGPHPQRIMNLMEKGWGKDEIQKKHGHVVAVRQVSLSLRQGEIFVLMGLSGSGKSSLLRVINGLHRPTAGHAYLHHQGEKTDLMRCPRKVLRDIRKTRMSMVFQQFGLLPWRTVGENIAYALELQDMPKKEHRKKIEQYLELVGLQNWMHKFPHELSGGMQQRVGLARALATEADILLMDEPFSALDPLIRQQMQKELLEIQKRFQKTILFVCHDFEEAIKLGDRIGIMKNGCMIKVGTPSEILGNDQCERIQVQKWPVTLTDPNGNFLGVVGGNEIFKDLLQTNDSMF